MAALGENLSDRFAALEHAVQSLYELDPRDGGDVRRCLNDLRTYRETLENCDRYAEGLAVAFDIPTPDGVLTRRLGAFLDHDRRVDVSHPAYLLRGLVTLAEDWLTIAAQSRGLMAAGERLDGRIEWRLEVATCPPADRTGVDQVLRCPGEPAKRRPSNRDVKRMKMDQLQRLVVGLHVPDTSNAATAELARQNAEVRELAKELGKTLDAGFVQSCRAAQRQKAKAKK